MGDSMETDEFDALWEALERERIGFEAFLYGISVALNEEVETESAAAFNASVRAAWADYDAEARR